MKLRIGLVLFLFVVSLGAVTRQEAVRLLESAPLRFEPAAEGDSSHFVARGARYGFSFAGNEAIFQAAKKRIRLRFEGAAPEAKMEGTELLPSTTAIYVGNDPSRWRPVIPNYERLQVRELYCGIDLVYYGSAGELEYDLTVKPGADPTQIRLRLDGGRAHVDRDGNLVATLIQKRPVAYQIAADGSKVAVASRYRKNADGTYGFVLGSYDRTRELVIDPVLTFSHYIGGGGQDTAQVVALDKNGLVYVAGTTLSTNLPVTGSIYPTNQGAADIFVERINPNAKHNQVNFLTYLGGTANETLGGMAVSPEGDIYLTGTTQSGNFPMVNAAQSTLSGTTDVFVASIDFNRKLVYSTYLGGKGDEVGVGITVDAKGKIYVTGGTDSTDFPTNSAFQGSKSGVQDAFFAVFEPSLSGSATRIYSSYLGGSGWDIGRGIALAPDGTVWIAGGTYSFNFPHHGNSYRSNYSGTGDAFVAHINPSRGSSGLEYTSYLGGNNVDEAKDVAVDSEGRVIVSGWTNSVNFPTTSDALQTQYGGNTDAFVAILDTTKTDQLVYSTFFGGDQPDVPFDMKLDTAGNIYLCGFTLSPGLPATAKAAQAAYDGTIDVFALRFNPATAGAAGINYMSYLGSDGLQIGYGIAFDSNENIYLVGTTSGPLFKALHGAAKTSIAGKVDGFVAAVSTK